jgi:hypothetical protein
MGMDEVRDLTGFSAWPVSRYTGIDVTQRFRDPGERPATAGSRLEKRRTVVTITEDRHLLPFCITTARAYTSP